MATGTSSVRLPTENTIISVQFVGTITKAS
jgi:hypothetical protein